MAPGEFQAGCQILADGFVAGITLLTKVIWHSIEEDRTWRAELRKQDAVRDAAHTTRMAEITGNHGT